MVRVFEAALACGCRPSLVRLHGLQSPRHITQADLQSLQYLLVDLDLFFSYFVASLQWNVKFRHSDKSSGCTGIKVQVQVTCVGMLKRLQDLLGDLDFFFSFMFASLSLKLERKEIFQVVKE